MGFERDGAEGEFGEGFCDADYGFELADCNGDRGARGGGDFGGVDLAADGYEVGRELFAGFGGEAGCAAAGKNVSKRHRILAEGHCVSYDLQ